LRTAGLSQRKPASAGASCGNFMLRGAIRERSSISPYFHICLLITYRHVLFLPD
jgi:hypothetical protein